jgi:hypothetical protein
MMSAVHMTSSAVNLAKTIAKWFRKLDFKITI